MDLHLACGSGGSPLARKVVRSHQQLVAWAWSPEAPRRASPSYSP
eukprot:COSAG02_NODE_49880_length_324_cov_0.684444_1_plen_44_part_01